MSNYLKSHFASFLQSTECLTSFLHTELPLGVLKVIECRAHDLILVGANGKCQVLVDTAVRDVDFNMKYTYFVCLPNLSLSPPSFPHCFLWGKPTD